MIHFKENIKQANNQTGVRVLYGKGVASKANSEVLKAQRLRDGIIHFDPINPYKNIGAQMSFSQPFITPRTRKDKFYTQVNTLIGTK